MTFWQIYFPVLVAMLSFFVITEFVGFCLSLLLRKKSQAAQEEYEAKMASGEIANPMEIMFGGGGNFGMTVAPTPVASGQKEIADVGYGNYP